MRVLVTGVGGPAGQNLVACLRLAGHTIIGVDANAYHLAAADADQRYHVPPTDQLADWIATIRHLARGTDLILPQPDCDVWALAAHRHIFGGLLRLPATRAIEICQDKLATSEVLAGDGVPTAAWTGPETVMEMLRAHGAPVWLRARRGAGGRGSMKAYSVEQAEAWITYCEQAKGIAPEEFLVCAYLPGREFAVQQLWDEGRLVASQSRERLEYLFGYLSPTGQTSTPAVARTVRDERLSMLAREAVKRVAECPHGVFGIDIKEGAGGRPFVTEINAGRFYTTSYFFAVAGLNLPALLFAQACSASGSPVIDSLPPDLYWVRTMDRPPQLLHASQLEGSDLFRSITVRWRGGPA